MTCNQYAINIFKYMQYDMQNKYIQIYSINIFKYIQYVNDSWLWDFMSIAAIAAYMCNNYIYVNDTCIWEVMSIAAITTYMWMTREYERSCV